MAQHRHKRETNARRPKVVHLAGSVAVMATMSAVSLGVLTADPLDSRDFMATPASSITSPSSSESSDVVRAEIVSRSASRLSAPKSSKRGTDREAKRGATQDAQQAGRKSTADLDKQATARTVSSADTLRWTTTELNLWSGPDDDAEKVGLVDGLEKILVTGRTANGRVEVVINDRSRWVSSGYLAAVKPAPEPTEPTLGGACTNGSSVAGQPNVIDVHQAVCSAFPEVTSYGTYRSDGEHAQGRAIDIMVSGEHGWQVAEFVRANYAALGVSYIIFSQNIWSVERGGEGWRSMSDRGSSTANHYDHVHVTTY